MSNPPFSISFLPPSPPVLKLELTLVELDFGLLLEDFLDRWSKVQPLLFMVVLYWGYVFQFMYFELVKMDIMYFDSGFDDVIKLMYFPLQWNKVLNFQVLFISVLLLSFYSIHT